MKNRKLIFDDKMVAIIAIVLLVVTIIPLIYIGKYNHPSADDFSYGANTHLVWEETGSIIKVVSTAFKKVNSMYNEWQGTYSSMFIMTLHPGVFSETLYGVASPIVMIGALCIGIMFFVFTLAKVLNTKANKSIAIIIASGILIGYIQQIYSPVQAFYWYNGSIHYTFMNGCLLVMISSAIQSMLESRKKYKIAWTVFATFMAIITSGANYVTAFAGLLCLVIMYVILAMYGKLKESLYTIPVSIAAVAGFIVSAVAPGNNIRQDALQGNTTMIFDTILRSFKSTVTYMNAWNTILIFLILILLIPFILKLILNSKCEFKYPLFIVVMSFCLVSALFAPMVFTTGSAGPERSISAIQLFYYISLVVDEIYIIGWFVRKSENSLGIEDLNNRLKLFVNQNLKSYVLGVFAVTAMLLMFSNSQFYTTGIAIDSIKSGEAKKYHEEYLARLDILVNFPEDEVYLSEFTEKPTLLYFDDIESDKKNWKNKAMAKFYSKKRVTLIEHR